MVLLPRWMKSLWGELGKSLWRVFALVLQIDSHAGLVFPSVSVSEFESCSRSRNGVRDWYFALQKLTLAFCLFRFDFFLCIYIKQHPCWLRICPAHGNSSILWAVSVDPCMEPRLPWLLFWPCCLLLADTYTCSMRVSAAPWLLLGRVLLSPCSWGAQFCTSTPDG